MSGLGARERPRQSCRRLRKDPGADGQDWQSHNQDEERRDGYGGSLHRQRGSVLKNVDVKTVTHFEFSHCAGKTFKTAGCKREMGARPLDHERAVYDLDVSGIHIP